MRALPFPGGQVGEMHQMRICFISLRGNILEETDLEGSDKGDRALTVQLVVTKVIEL